MTSSTTEDVRDILDLQTAEPGFITKEALLSDKKKKQVKKIETFKRPEGMHRELWGLLWTDNKDAPPIIPTDTSQGYKQMKAKIGRSHVRPWKWMSFSNAARKDGAVFHHWRRLADEGKDYPFAKFNKSVDVPIYSDLEYQQHFHDDSWTRAETDALFDLCKRFDMRFIVIHDRWDRDKFPDRKVEDLKERYYNICNTLAKARSAHGHDTKIRVFDATHERRRKEQLIKLFNRTPEQCEEEEQLVQEMKKIELRKREREKKTQDLQKLITAADTNIDSRKFERKGNFKKKAQQVYKTKEGVGMTPDSTGIKFSDFKQSGVTLRSQRMKLPTSVGQKKTKAIEQVLDELGIEINPIPTEEIVTHFNELRQDIVLLYELKLAQTNCEYELQTLRHRYETLAPGQVLDVGVSTPLPSSIPLATMVTMETESPSKSKKISETLDVIGVPGTPLRKRKAALEQANVIKKIKGFKGTL